jgi:hypothetical protein
MLNGKTIEVVSDLRIVKIIIAILEARYKIVILSLIMAKIVELCLRIKSQEVIVKKEYKWGMVQVLERREITVKHLMLHWFKASKYFRLKYCILRCSVVLE